jgi:hypothetical protein
MAMQIRQAVQHTQIMNVAGQMLKMLLCKLQIRQQIIHSFRSKDDLSP